MNLKKIYDEFVELNGAFLVFINQAINSDFNDFKEEYILKILKDHKEKCEEMMAEVDKFEIEEQDGVLLKDVKYVVLDGLFLSIDLYNFYNSKQLERFKMRAVNYIRKGRVTNFFQI